MKLYVLTSERWCEKYLVAWALNDADAIKKVQENWCEYDDLHVEYSYTIDSFDGVIFTDSWA